MNMIVTIEEGGAMDNVVVVGIVFVLCGDQCFLYVVVVYYFI